MNINDLINFIRNNNIQIRIEVEGNVDKLTRFIAKYNSIYNSSITLGTDGIRPLHQGANKFGVQKRIYFSSITNIPVEFQSMIKDNQVMTPYIYPYRINSKNVVNALFANGFVIGNN